MRIVANALVEAGAKAGNSAVENFKINAALWDLLFDTRFPIHSLDPKLLIYITPIPTVNGEHPSSGGLADGSVVNPATNTGGTQLDGQRDDEKYVTPEHQLDPGNMYSEESSSSKGKIKASETIGQPIEAVIGGRKRLLRVDIEPNGKLQIQSGGGKDSIVDFRPGLSKPLAPQINQAFKRLPQSARDQLIRNAEKGLKRLQDTGDM